MLRIHYLKYALYVCMYMCVLFVCEYAYTCKSGCVYVYMYIYTYMNIYVYTYVIGMQVLYMPTLNIAIFKFDIYYIFSIHIHVLSFFPP